MAKRRVSVGKYRALYRASAGGLFTILALDHQDALRSVMNPAAPMDISDDEIVAFKHDVVSIVGRKCSGILLDPLYSAAQAIHNNTVNQIGLLVELEKADYEMNPLPRVVELRSDWCVAKIKRMGADGVKLFFYYNPDDVEIAQQQEQIVSRVVEQCDIYDIPLYAEPIIYPFRDAADSAAYATDRARLVIESAQRIAELGADVLKLEFPLDIAHNLDEAQWADACRQLTNRIDCPWVLLSAGVDYESFRKQVRIACENGASGYIGGRAIWGEACQFTERTERVSWLNKTGTERIDELSAIVNQYARRWSDVIDCEPVSTTWYQSYEGDE